MNQELEKLKKEFLKDPKFRKAYLTRDSAFEIGEMVLDARIKRGWPQEKLAKKAGMLQPAIARIERGIIMPSIATLQKIADAFGMQLELPSFVEKPSTRKARKWQKAIEAVNISRNVEAV